MVAPQVDNKQVAPKAFKVTYQPDDSDEENKSVSFDGVSIRFERGIPRPCGELLARGLLRQPEKFKPSVGDTNAMELAAQIEAERKAAAAPVPTPSKEA